MCIIRLAPHLDGQCSPAFINSSSQPRPPAPAPPLPGLDGQSIPAPLALMASASQSTSSSDPSSMTASSRCRRSSSARQELAPPPSLRRNNGGGRELGQDGRSTAASNVPEHAWLCVQCTAHVALVELPDSKRDGSAGRRGPPPPQRRQPTCRLHRQSGPPGAAAAGARHRTSGLLLKAWQNGQDGTSSVGAVEQGACVLVCTCAGTVLGGCLLSGEQSGMPLHACCILARRCSLQSPPESDAEESERYRRLRPLPALPCRPWLRPYP